MRRARRFGRRFGGALIGPLGGAMRDFLAAAGVVLLLILAIGLFIVWFIDRASGASCQTEVTGAGCVTVVKSAGHAMKPSGFNELPDP